MKIFFSKHGKEIIFAFIIVICFICLVNVVAQVSSYTDSLNAQAVERSAFCVEEQKLDLQVNTDRIYDCARAVAANVELCQTEEELYTALMNAHDIVGADDAYFSDAYYINAGTLRDAHGDAVAQYAELSALATAEGEKTTRVFQYKQLSQAVGFSVPVVSKLADRVILVFNRATLSSFIFTNEQRTQVADCCKKSCFTLLCRHDGAVMERLANDSLIDVSASAVQEGVLEDWVTDSKDYSALTELVNKGESGSRIISVNAESYVVMVDNMGERNGDVFLLNMFRLTDMYNEGYNLINLIWGTLCVFFALLAILSLYMIISQLGMYKKIFELSNINKKLGCSTLTKFEQETAELLKLHKGTKFAIVIARFRNFSYIAEKYGEDDANDLLKFSVNILKGSITTGEVFAYDNDGEFYLLFHYREQKTLVDRLESIRKRLIKYTGLSDKGYKLSVVMDVYEVERDTNQSIQVMINKVGTVRNMENGGETKNILFYSEVARDTYLQKAEIEGTMEQALRDCEFHIFYQPKFNFEKKTIDGSEILVRWFDAKKDIYRKPDVFIPVFEENGFITKLDHFVFYKACENAVYCQKNGVPVYPISVNVSRVTAMQPDFVEYYTRIKRKFDLPADFITIEFTESFAYENYEYLGSLIAQLHREGFICSLDDFGTGYSSYNILKVLDMDEIKLDRFFIGKGMSAERDRLILDGVIRMLKSMGMKVTQEGIETKEDFDRLRKMGCDIIQGYFFAKPMKFAHYCEFVTANFPHQH